MKKHVKDSALCLSLKSMELMSTGPCLLTASSQSICQVSRLSYFFGRDRMRRIKSVMDVKIAGCGFCYLIFHTRFVKWVSSSCAGARLSSLPRRLHSRCSQCNHVCAQVLTSSLWQSLTVTLLSLFVSDTARKLQIHYSMQCVQLNCHVHFEYVRLCRTEYVCYACSP